MFQYHINLRFISFEQVLVISFLNIILKNRLHVYNRFRFTSNPSDIQFISNARYICVQRNMRYAFFVVLLWTVQCDQLKYIQLSSSRVDYLYNNNTSTYVVYLCRSMLTRKKTQVWWFPVLISLCTVTAHRLIFTYVDLYYNNNFFWRFCAWRSNVRQPLLREIKYACSELRKKTSRGGVFYERRIGPNKKIFFIL